MDFDEDRMIRQYTSRKASQDVQRTAARAALDRQRAWEREGRAGAVSRHERAVVTEFEGKANPVTGDKDSGFTVTEMPSAKDDATHRVIITDKQPVSEEFTSSVEGMGALRVLAVRNLLDQLDAPKDLLADAVARFTRGKRLQYDHRKAEKDLERRRQLCIEDLAADRQSTEDLSSILAQQETIKQLLHADKAAQRMIFEDIEAVLEDQGSPDSPLWSWCREEIARCVDNARSHFETVPDEWRTLPDRQHGANPNEPLTAKTDTDFRLANPVAFAGLESALRRILLVQQVSNSIPTAMLPKRYEVSSMIRDHVGTTTDSMSALCAVVARRTWFERPGLVAGLTVDRAPVWSFGLVCASEANPGLFHRSEWFEPVEVGAVYADVAHQWAQSLGDARPAEVARLMTSVGVPTGVAKELSGSRVSRGRLRAMFGGGRELPEVKVLKPEIR